MATHQVMRKPFSYLLLLAWPSACGGDNIIVGTNDSGNDATSQSDVLYAKDVQNGQDAQNAQDGSPSDAGSDGNPSSKDSGPACFVDAGSPPDFVCGATYCNKETEFCVPGTAFPSCTALPCACTGTNETCACLASYVAPCPDGGAPSCSGSGTYGVFFVCQ